MEPDELPDGPDEPDEPDDAVEDPDEDEDSEDPEEEEDVNDPPPELPPLPEELPVVLNPVGAGAAEQATPRVRVPRARTDQPRGPEEVRMRISNARSRPSRP
jgi:hypothetical protein